MLPLIATGLMTLGVVFGYLKTVRYVFRLWRSAPSLLLRFTIPPLFVLGSLAGAYPALRWTWESGAWLIYGVPFPVGALKYHRILGPQHYNSPMVFACLNLLFWSGIAAGASAAILAWSERSASPPQG